ncbi:hypothetical protein Goari_002905, partial [Gossypium aridum]|nr:hypothetical protein [Gossypium aridum]
KKIPKKKKDIRCHECVGCGHNQVECANILNKNKKSLCIAWSDDGSSCEPKDDEEHQSNYLIFTSKVVNAVTIDLDNYSYSHVESIEDFMDNYKTMLNKWDLVCKINKRLTDENFRLKQEN